MKPITNEKETYIIKKSVVNSAIKTRIFLSGLYLDNSHDKKFE